MTRLLRFLLRNWPLKLAAVLLATMLYSGLVLSQNVRTFSGSVPVDPIRASAEATLLTEIEPVREIRFRAPLDVGVLSADSFRATVNLSGIEAREGGEAQDVPVVLTVIDRRVQIVDFVPRTVQIRLDSIEEREMAITAQHNAPPEGLSVGTPQTEPSEVRIRGAGSRISAVRSVVARVTIDASGLNVNRDVPLVAVDADGNEVPDVELEPSRANVRITVAVELATRTLAVVPAIVGELPPGYAITSVVVDPLTVTVSGSEDEITRLESAPTELIDVGGRTRDFETNLGLDLPDQVDTIGSGQVRVTLTISQQSGSRTYLSGLLLAGASPDLTYTPAVTQVSITLQGPLVELDGVDPGQLVAQVDVTDLPPGSHVVPVTVAPPGGLEVVGISPSEAMVNVEPAPEVEPFDPFGAVVGSRL
jgi:YbbR domain-containing protein